MSHEIRTLDRLWENLDMSAFLRTKRPVIMIQVFSVVVATVFACTCVAQDPRAQDDQNIVTVDDLIYDLLGGPPYNTHFGAPWGAHEGLLHGVPSHYSWYSGASPGHWMERGRNQAINIWGQAYEWQNGSPEKNIRIQVRNLRLFAYVNGRWDVVVESYDSIDGSNYREGFSESADLSVVRSEKNNGGGISFNMVPGYNYHWWVHKWPRARIPQGALAFYTITEARLIPDTDPNVDLSKAKYLVGIGDDYYPTPTAPGPGPWPSLAISRHRFLTAQWQTFTSYISGDRPVSEQAYRELILSRTLPPGVGEPQDSPTPNIRERVLLYYDFEAGEDLTAWNSWQVQSNLVQHLYGAMIPDGPVQGQSCMQLNVDQIRSQPWDAQYWHTLPASLLPLKQGERYTMSAYFKTRQGTMEFDFMIERGQSPWGRAINQRITVGEEWELIKLSSEDLAEDFSPGVINLHLGQTTGVLWMDDFKFAVVTPLVSQFKFEGDLMDTAGNPVDPNGLVGADPDDPDTWPVFIPGIDGLALALDGLTQYVDLGPDYGTAVMKPLDSFSIAVWINGSREYELWPHIFESGQDADHYIALLAFTDGSPQYPVWGALGGPRLEFTCLDHEDGESRQLSLESSGEFILEGEWAHITVTVNASTATAALYMDGSLVNDCDEFTRKPSDIGQYTYTLVGNSVDNRMFYGMLDELMIFNRALTADEVVQLATLPEDSYDKSGAKVDRPGFPNHHLHNFASSDAMTYHAEAMGYYFAGSRKPDDPAFAEIGIIRMLNARVGPVRVHIQISTGDIYVSYLPTLCDSATGRSMLAGEYGLERLDYRRYPITQTDWEILSGYSAARKDPQHLQLEELDHETLEEYFFLTWIVREPDWIGFNFSANWQSKKVTADYIRIVTENMPWKKFDALFFDSFGSRDLPTSANAEFGGLGAHTDRRAGQLHFVKSVTDVARDTAKTGRNVPCMLFTNIYHPKSNECQDILEYYGENLLRLDHYYYEKGGLGTQAPNGTIPGTDIPAYVSSANPAHYLPADKVALDDVYAFNRSDYDGKDTYERSAHFYQHLDACGTAGLHGAWFGWYGEDSVALRDKQGRLIYTNDLQLLRAIPNWDNMAGLSVPPFGKATDADARRWDGKVYKSPRSCASEEVIYSRHPLTQELFVVFRTLDGVVRLGPGEKMRQAILVDDWFRSTDTDVQPCLEVEGDKLRLKSRAADILGKGIRLILEGP